MRPGLRAAATAPQRREGGRRLGDRGCGWWWWGALRAAPATRPLLQPQPAGRSGRGRSSRPPPAQRGRRGRPARTSVLAAGGRARGTRGSKSGGRSAARGTGRHRGEEAGTWGLEGAEARGCGDVLVRRARGPEEAGVSRSPGCCRRRGIQRGVGKPRTAPPQSSPCLRPSLRAHTVGLALTLWSQGSVYSLASSASLGLLAKLLGLHFKRRTKDPNRVPPSGSSRPLGSLKAGLGLHYCVPTAWHMIGSQWTVGGYRRNGCVRELPPLRHRAHSRDSKQRWRAVVGGLAQKH